MSENEVISSGVDPEMVEDGFIDGIIEKSMSEEESGSEGEWFVIGRDGFRGSEIFLIAKFSSGSVLMMTRPFRNRDNSKLLNACPQISVETYFRAVLNDRSSYIARVRWLICKER
ncbi:hypothetical protein L596_017985 [Steinernema carpocapsae]|uniref:Uncharacterized protein n=1 Tax=Steinernema carpocapsae TaxID=34508 RepID=A0A4V6A1X1_STECR|nr:hypothetical protein L596_017985 [Steinernema carpocapsae]